MTSSHVSPSRGLSIAACALVALAAPAHVGAQSHDEASPAPTQIDAVVVSALRTPQDPKAIPSSVSVFSLPELEAAQIPSLEYALNLTPGVMVFNNGAAGSQATLYMRGSSMAQSLIVVDGVRISSRQSEFYLRTVLGNMGLGGFDRIEVLRGPQGTLYGSAAMGGVLVLETTRGCGPATGAVAAEFGRNATWNTAAKVSGGTQTVGYSASFGYQRTDNEAPRNANRAVNGSARLEKTLADDFVVGLTYRGSEGRFQTTGPGYSPNPGDNESSSHLGTTYVGYTGESLRSRLTYGWNQVDYAYADSWGPSNAQATGQVLDWQNSWTPLSQLVVVGGGTANWDRFKQGGLPGTLASDSAGLYLNLNYSPVRDLNLQVGGRHDEFSMADDEQTGRAGVSYYVRATGTKLRATYGTAYAVPSMVERFGSGANGWYVANPDLAPESSKGYDVGFDQELWSGRVVWESSLFRNRYKDMILSNAVAGGKYQYSNVARALSEGWENALSVRLHDSVTLRVNYTYMEVWNQSTHARVVYKPRHTGGASLLWNAGKKLVLGGGLQFVADRRGTDYASWPSRVVDAGDYTTARLHASYELHKDLVLKLRVENALDEKYEETLTYPALPAAVYTGVEYRF